MLKITNVELHNFCQHEHLNLALPGGLIGLVGANGSGKSTIAHAIRGALTGVFKRFPADTAAGCIRQGHDGHATVVLEGRLAWTPFILSRTIGKTSVKHRLVVNGEVYSEKANEIEAWLTEASGLTPQLMSEFMFIGQQEIYSFLDATDTERSKKFTALCGTKVYEKLRDEYFDMLKTDKAKFDAVNETIIESLEQQITALDEKILQYTNDGTALSEKADEDWSEEEWTKELEGEQRYLQFLTEYEQTTWQMEKENERARGLKDSLKHDKKAANNRRQRAEELSHVMQAVRNERGMKSIDDVLAFYDECMEAHKTLLRLEAEQKEKTKIARATDQKCLDAKEVYVRLAEKYDLADAPSKVEDLVEQETKLRDELSVLQHKLELVVLLKRVLSGDKTRQCCPLCEADKRDWGVDAVTFAKRDIDLNARVETVTKSLRDLKEELATIGEAERHADEFQRKIERLTVAAEQQWAEVERIKAEKVDLVDGLGYEDYEDYEDVKVKRNYVVTLLDEQRECIAESQRLDRSISQTEKLMESITKQIEDLEKHKESLLGKFKEPKDLTDTVTNTEKTIKQLKQKIVEARSLEEEIKQIARLKSAAMADRADLRQRLTTAQNALKASGDTQRWFEYCDKALAWLRKDGLPRLVHANVLKQLCSVVNEELRLFDDPFRVEVSDDLSFVAYFEDERVIPSKALSGGQKVMLALSFWSAVSRVFAKNLGVMCLDEPSDGLDVDNNELFLQILQQWRQLLHQRGQQVILITHSTDVETVCDHVIKL